MHPARMSASSARRLRPVSPGIVLAVLIAAIGAQITRLLVPGRGNYLVALVCAAVGLLAAELVALGGHGGPSLGAVHPVADARRHRRSPRRSAWCSPPRAGSVADNPGQRPSTGAPPCAFPPCLRAARRRRRGRRDRVLARRRAPAARRPRPNRRRRSPRVASGCARPPRRAPTRTARSLTNADKGYFNKQDDTDHV